MKTFKPSRLDGINLLLISLITFLVLGSELFDQIPGVALLDLPVHNINHIRVIKNKHLQLELRHNKQGWRINHPISEPAADNKINILLALSAARSTLQLNAKHQNFNNFGFNEENLQISFNQEKLQFGGINKTSGLRYVLHNNTIYLINDTYYRIANLPAKHYKESTP